MQNAIDAEAKQILVFVDQQQRTVFMLDNGKGVVEDKFNKGIRTVGQTMKSKSKLGRYGIGAISPFNKCEVFYFISKGDQRGYVCWPFEAAKIRKATTSLKVQPVLLKEPPPMPTLLDTAIDDYLPTGKWQTMLIMERVTEDKAIGLINMDEFEEKILGALGPRMQQLGVTCRIVVIREDGKTDERDIKPRSYAGTPLGTFELEGNLCGNVTLELYRTPLLPGRKTREGSIGVSEAEVIYPVPWANVRQQALMSAWVKEYKADLMPMIDAFSRGIVEGLVLVDNITLHPERNKFVFGDHMVDLLTVLAAWYDTDGHELFQEEELEERDQHQRRLVMEVLGDVGEWANAGGEWRNMLDEIRTTITFGRVGEGHTDFAGGELENKLTTRSGKGGAGKQRNPSEPKERGPARGPRGANQETPTGVMGAGRRRSKVRDNSTGLWIDVVDFTLGTQLFSFDRETGELLFNSGNELWSELYGARERRRTAKNDRWIKQLMKWVIIEVFAHLSMPPEQFDAVCELLNKRAPIFADALIKGR
ncbi:MAG TPA: ATP-binding protein [Magnetospirillaceae bacterium]|nr:ATP-binding protein [Magnetospirillaceae bacterium]